MSTTNTRTPGKLVFKRPKPKLTLVPPPTDDPAPEVSKVEFSENVKEMLREMQTRRRARRDGSDTPDAA
jgi:hypothetical protein